MSNPHIENLKSNLASPARTYMWDVVLPFDSQLLMVRAQSTSLPSVAVNPIQVPYKQTGGAVFHGKLKYDQSWDVTFVEGEDAQVMKDLIAALSHVVDPATGLGRPDNVIKRPVTLSLNTVEDVPYHTINLIGCWVSKIEAVPLSYREDGAINIKANLAFDYWLPGDAGGGVLGSIRNIAGALGF